MSAAEWVVSIWLTLDALAAIVLIGQPRKTVTPGLAITTVLLHGVLIAWLART